MSSGTQAPPLPRIPQQRADALPEPTDAGDLVWRELDREFTRYDRQAGRHRVAYLTLRMVVLAVGAAVTVLAAVGASPALTASLAAVVVVAEGAQQLFQLHTRWIAYRLAAETLRRQAFRYVAELAPYDDPATRRARLAAALEEVTTGEHDTWQRSMQQDAARDPARA
ncbi:DUF4231 domain-containing protein [Blastococcus sp. SYSU D00922]